MTIDIVVPSLGESITEATIAKWLKKVGETIEVDEIIAELETDKVTQEIYSSSSGKIVDILYPEGSDVSIGTIIAKIDNSTSVVKEKITKKAEEKDLDLNRQLGEKNKSIQEDTKEELIKVPNVGESITEVTVAKWMKKVGDPINVDEILVEIETDKATQEIYSGIDGTLSEIYFVEGKDVKVGETIGKIIGSAKMRVDSLENGIKEISEIKENKVDLNYDSLDPSRIRRSGFQNKITLNDIKEFLHGKVLSPAVRKVVLEKNIDLKNVIGSGPRGRITKHDVDLLKQGDTLIATGLKDSNEERKSMSRMRQSIAKRLKEAQNTAAMLTTFNEVDMTAVKELRSKYKENFEKKYSVKLGFMSFFIKASISVLKEIPEVNAEIDGKDIVYKNRYDIGVAVGTPQGLLVPVIRNADNKSFSEIEKEIIYFGKLARDNKINLEQMKDGTFTISNGGVYGSMLSTPILNTPQSGILGLHNIVDRPVVVNGDITVRPIMYLALTYDHRIIDGREAVTFLVKLKSIIEKPEKLLFDL